MTSLTKPVAPTAKSETSVSAPRKIFRHNERLEWRLRADRTNVVRPDFMAILANRSANLGPAHACARQEHESQRSRVDLRVSRWEYGSLRWKKSLEQR